MVVNVLPALVGYRNEPMGMAHEKCLNELDQRRETIVDNTYNCTFSDACGRPLAYERLKIDRLN